MGHEQIELFFGNLGTALAPAVIESGFRELADPEGDEPSFAETLFGQAADITKEVRENIASGAAAVTVDPTGKTPRQVQKESRERAGSALALGGLALAAFFIFR